MFSDRNGKVRVFSFLSYLVFVIQVIFNFLVIFISDETVSILTKKCYRLENKKYICIMVIDSYIHKFL